MPKKYEEYTPLHSLANELELLGWPDAEVTVRGAAEPMLWMKLSIDAELQVTFEDNAYFVWRREFDRSHGVRAEEEIGIVYATDLTARFIDQYLYLGIKAERRAEAEIDRASQE